MNYAPATPALVRSVVRMGVASELSPQVVFSGSHLDGGHRLPVTDSIQPATTIEARLVQRKLRELAEIGKRVERSV